MPLSPCEKMVTGAPILSRMEPAQANQLVPGLLTTNTFFKPFNRQELYTANGSMLAATPSVRAEMLAEALPAVTRATGSNPLTVFGSRNSNLMALKDGWPTGRPTPDNGSDKPWFHSDFKDVAFRYVHQFYRDLIQKGGLD